MFKKHNSPCKKKDCIVCNCSPPKEPCNDEKPKFNWEAFKNEKIAVYWKTEEERDNLLNECEKHNLRWATGEKATEIKDINTCICYNFSRKERGTALFDGLSHQTKEYYEINGCKILNWSDYMKKEFTKEDLKPFMLVETRNGFRYLVAVDNILINDNQKWNNLSDYKNDFSVSNGFGKEWDIIKVYSVPNFKCEYLNLTTEDRELLWERKEVKEMTIAEISEALGYDVKIVKEKQND